MARFLFPEWTETFTKWVGGIAVAAPVFLIALAYSYGVTADTIRIGYQPKQPVPYSHALHAGEMAIDCRYCHTAVEDSHRASIPTASVCMNCHATIRHESKDLELVRAAFQAGQKPAAKADGDAATEAVPPPSLEWVRVYDLPDHVYFNHSAHVTRGVGCESCHGRIDRMEVVYQTTPLTMEWCLGCHNQPEEHLREPENVTVMGYGPPGQNGDGDVELRRAHGKTLREANNINPPVNCSTCHR